MQEIVSVEWLSQNIENENLILLDSSPISNVSGKISSCADRQIKGSKVFDLKNNFSDKSSPMPNTVPTPKQFETECQKLGINQDSIIVIYDNLGLYTSPRSWWLFKVMGHENVAVLDGGLPEWINEGQHTVEKGDVMLTSEIGNFKAHFRAEYVVTFDEVKSNSLNPSYDIIDARSKGRYEGTAPEPRANLQSGSIPHSNCIPHTSVVENGRFKSAEEIRDLFEEIGISSNDTVYSCGSGLTACIIMMAGRKAGIDSLKVYDGSWTEWATRNELFV